MHIEAAISLRKNASTSTKARGFPLLRDEVQLISKLGYDKWEELKDAGRRWIEEIVFSSIKRVLGKDLLSKKFRAHKVEAALKVMIYNKLVSLWVGNKTSEWTVFYFYLGIELQCIFSEMSILLQEE